MATIQFLRNLFGLLDRGERIQFIGLVVMMLLAAGLEVIGIGMVIPFIGLLADVGQIEKNTYLRDIYRWSGASSPNNFLFLLGATLLLVYLAKNTYLGLVTYAQSKLVFTKQAKISRRLLQRYMNSPYAFHLQHNSGDLLKNVISEVSNVFYGLLLPFLTLIAECLVLLFIVLFLIVAEPKVALTTITIIGITGHLIQTLLKRTVSSIGNKRAEYAGLLYKQASQSLGSVKEAKILGRENYFTDAFGRTADNYARTTQIFVTLNALPRLMMETIVVGTMLAVIGILLGMKVNMAQTLPMLALFAMAAIRLLPSITRIFVSMNSLRFYAPALDAIRRDIDISAHDKHNKSFNTVEMEPAGTQKLRIGEAVALRGVWHRYTKSGAWSLRNISLTIPRGKMIGLVGPTGAGKSTLIDLVLGLLHPTEGAITVDGHDIQSVLGRWQISIGYVPQMIYLLDDSVRRNIAFGLPDDQIDDDRVWQVLRISCLEDMVRTTVRGLDEVVGERGVRISGGERQRIGIARALYHDPEVLVFDEATSALDTTTESEIINTLDQLAESKTLLVIAHRLNTVRHCNRIYFIKDGAIADSGTFEELAAKNQDFRKMVGNAR